MSNIEDTPARRKAMQAEKKKYIQNRMKEFTLSLCSRADDTFGGEPYRVPFRVMVKKPKEYYAAAVEAVAVLADRHYLLTKKSDELFTELNSYIQRRIGGEAFVNKSYWYKPLTGVQLKQIGVLIGRHWPFEPTKHNQLNLIADLLRAGHSCDGDTMGRPTGGTTRIGMVQFLSKKAVILSGTQHAIHWRKGNPYCRQEDGAERNLYTLLEGGGVLREDVNLWLANAEARDTALREKATAVAERHEEEAAIDWDDFKVDDCSMFRSQGLQI